MLSFRRLWIFFYIICKVFITMDSTCINAHILDQNYSYIVNTIKYSTRINVKTGHNYTSFGTKYLGVIKC